MDKIKKINKELDNQYNEILDETERAVYGVGSNIIKSMDTSKDINIDKILEDIGQTGASGNRHFSPFELKDARPSNGKKPTTFVQEEMINMFKDIGNREVILEGHRFYIDQCREMNYICNNMPQIADSIEKQVDDILSPDNFTKMSLLFKINSHKNDISTTEISDVLKEHSIDNLLRETMIKTMIHGTQFMYIVPYKNIARSITANNKNTLIAESDLEGGDEMLYVESLVDATNEFFHDNDYSELYAESATGDNIRNPLGLRFFTDSPLLDEVKGAITRNVYNLYKESLVNISTDMELFGGSNKKKKAIKKSSFDKMTGCYTSLLPLERTIPVIINKKMIGVYYIERSEMSNADRQRLGSQYHNLLGYDSFDDNSSSLNNNPMLKQQIMMELSSLISRNMSENFITENKQVLDTIEKILDENEMFDMNFKVRFIPNEYLVDFTIKPKADGMGTSVLSYARVPAHMWILLYKNYILNKLFYEKDMLVAKVRNSLSQDVYGNLMTAMESFSKMFPLPSELMNLERVYTGLSDRSRFLLPVGPNGQESMSFDKIEGQEIDQTAWEGLDRIEAIVTNLIGVSSDLMKVDNQAEFATTITAVNGMRVRKTIGLQQYFQPAINRCVSKIIEYEKGLLDVDIEAILPAPQALNDNTKVEHITKVGEKVEAILLRVYGDNPPADEKEAMVWEKKKAYVGKELFRDYTQTMVDWKLIEKLESDFTLSNMEGNLGDVAGEEEGAE